MEEYVSYAWAQLVSQRKSSARLGERYCPGNALEGAYVQHR